jgi:aspartate dehydrogenase
MALECAGHSAVKEYAAPLLRAGIDVIVSSVGVLADDQAAARMARRWLIRKTSTSAWLSHWWV